MKKSILIIGALLFMLGNILAQNLDPPDDTLQYDVLQKDTVINIDMSINVKSEPTHVIVNSEALENNEVLKAMLKAEREETMIIDKNLNKLVNNLNREEELLVKRRFLRKYHLNIVDLSNKEYKSQLASYILLFVIILIYILFLLRFQRLYMVKHTSDINANAIINIIVMLVFGYSIVGIITTIITKDTFLFENLTKLF